MGSEKMPDYEKMYQTLFCSMTRAITIMQQAQQTTEEIYLSAEPPDIRILNIIQGKDCVSADKSK